MASHLPSHRAARPLGLLAPWLAAGLAGCTSVGVGIALPIPGVGSVGVSVDSSGRVGGGVSVGTGGVHVGIGGTAQLPPPERPKPERGEPVAQGASAPAGAASGASN